MLISNNMIQAFASIIRVSCQFLHRCKKFNVMLFLLVINSYFPIEGLGADYKEYYKLPAVDAPVYSRHNYTKVVNQITAGCSTNYEKIRAIYKWMCDSISYDTSHTIYNADKCFRKRMGVCQAYSELFCSLAKAAGVNAEKVIGTAKTVYGIENPDNHAWVFAYTRENYGILLDVCWGAGYMVGNVFKHSNNPWIWFNVPPEWMIFSHFPTNRSYQLLDERISMRVFRSLPSIEGALGYGISAFDMLDKAKSEKITFPNFSIDGSDQIELLEFPLQSSLVLGEYYNFRIKMKKKGKMGFFTEKGLCDIFKWQSESDSIYSVRYMPLGSGETKLCVFNEQKQEWLTCLTYETKKPTSSDLDRLAQYHPLALLEMENVENLDLGIWLRFGIDEQNAARIIKQNNITSVPILNDFKGQKLKIVSIPMNFVLQAGTPYTFSFYPENGSGWVINNGDKWYDNWTVSADGLHTITVTPIVDGPLKLYGKVSDSDGASWETICYEVKYSL